MWFVCVCVRMKEILWSTGHDQVMIVLEFLPNGDLREFLNSLKSR